MTLTFDIGEHAAVEAEIGRLAGRDPGGRSPRKALSAFLSRTAKRHRRRGLECTRTRVAAELLEWSRSEGDVTLYARLPWDGPASRTAAFEDFLARRLSER